jgi:hypothetical protein
MNNCQCRETGQTNTTWVQAVYESSVRMLVDQKWDAVKLGRPAVSILDAVHID